MCYNRADGRTTLTNMVWGRAFPEYCSNGVVSMTNAKTLSEFLRDVMAARGLTERALAEGAGVSQSGISNLVQGKSREPDPRTLRALADFLDVEVFVMFRLMGYLPPADEIYGAYDAM